MDKLSCLLLGPYEIKRKLDHDNYELWLPSGMKIHPIFHISLLKPTENAGNERNEFKVHEVEKILDKRVRKGQTQYKVKWMG